MAPPAPRLRPGRGKLRGPDLDPLTAALDSPARPVLALIGGAKVSTKLDLLRFIIRKVDLLAIGGAMAKTMLLAQGKEGGRSLFGGDMADTAPPLLSLPGRHNCCGLLSRKAPRAP